MKIGLALPNSSMYPMLAKDFVTGVRHASSAFEDSDVRLLIEGIGSASDQGVIESALNKLVLQEDCDAIILFANNFMLEQILPKVNGFKVPTIVTNMGGNMINHFGTSEYVFTNSFGLWESAHMAAYFGYQNFGRKMAHGAHFYEAGYRLYESFFMGLEQIRGEVVYNLISKFEPDPNDFETLIYNTAKNEADFIFALYSDRDAVSFLNKLSNLEENGVHPIVASGVMLDKEILEKVNGTPKNFFNLTSWHPSLSSEQNRAVCSEFEEQTGSVMNYFSLLGYECGGSLLTAEKSELWSPKPTDRIKAIKSCHFEGPRGLIKFDNEDQASQFEQHVFTLNDNKEVVHYAPFGKLANRTQWLEKSRAQTGFNAWFQPYLCP